MAQQMSHFLWMQSGQPQSSNMPSSSENLRLSPHTSQMLGNIFSLWPAFFPNTTTSQTTLILVSLSNSLQSSPPPPPPPPTTPPSLSFETNLQTLSKMNFKKVSASGLLRRLTWNPSSAPSNHPLSLSSPSQPNSINSVFYKIIHSHTNLLWPFPIPPLIHLLTLMTFHNLGHFVRYLFTTSPVASRFTTCHKGCLQSLPHHSPPPVPMAHCSRST